MTAHIIDFAAMDARDANIDNPDSPYWQGQAEEAALVLDGMVLSGMLTEAALYEFYGAQPDNQSARDTWCALMRRIQGGAK